MAFRFRKSFNLGGARVNVSKSGVGGSLGCKGYRVTKKSNGGMRTTASLHGTGISYVKESSSKSKGRSISAETATNSQIFLFWMIFRVISILTIPLSLLLLIINPTVGLVFGAIGVAEWFAASHFKKQYKLTKTEEEI